MNDVVVVKNIILVLIYWGYETGKPTIFCQYFEENEIEEIRILHARTDIARIKLPAIV